MKYDNKGHPRLYKAIFMPKSFKHIFLQNNFDKKKMMNSNIMKTQFFLLNYI